MLTVMPVKVSLPVVAMSSVPPLMLTVLSDTLALL